jgi:hypothetical protein
MRCSESHQPCHERLAFFAPNSRISGWASTISISSGARAERGEVLRRSRNRPPTRKSFFCGYGEPRCGGATSWRSPKTLKQRGAKRLRLNTNGQADLINKRPVAAEMQGLIDAVSIS